mmetsp:Transcript_3757/g.10677  ORF Transcript_3757/g.10677 Transcript_3757/m.10677 type:complete len:90 (-) Transcript_3757:3778-4047(-)
MHRQSALFRLRPAAGNGRATAGQDGACNVMRHVMLCVMSWHVMSAVRCGAVQSELCIEEREQNDREKQDLKAYCAVQISLRREWISSKG